MDLFLYYQTMLAFLTLLLPLTLSPGPVNITLAGLGSAHGLMRAIPFFLGLTLSATIIAAFGGFGLNQVFSQYEGVYLTIRYVGIIYIFYLACKFFTHVPKTADHEIEDQFQNKASHGFMDGFLLTALNPKFYIMVAVLFGQFLKPGDAPGDANIGPLVVMFIAVLAASQFVWLMAGKTFKMVLKSPRIIRTEGKFFGLMLALTAVYLIWTSFPDTLAYVF